ncbi:MAG TPA: hypothetical protein VGN72_18840 [Tepidisphaeraceae bacterium]|jgi:hypothetical protein|nr:hypothetical protein [Tepidisphaeraceae bacterium]
MVDEKGVASRVRRCDETTANAIATAGVAARVRGGLGMRKSYFPSKDADFASWIGVFAAGIAEDPSRYGLQQSQSDLVSEVAAAYLAAYAVTAKPSMQSRAATIDKNQARERVKLVVRPIVSIIRGQTELSAAQQILIGLTVSGGRRTTVAPPDERPRVRVVSVSGRTVRLSLRGQIFGVRRRPRDARGATVFSYVGPHAAMDISAWRFCGNTQRATIDVAFPAELPPGSVVHLMACWYGTRSQPGPMSWPVQAYLGGGIAMPVGESVRVLRAAA